MKRIILTALLFLLWIGLIAQSSFKLQAGFALPILNDRINTTHASSNGPTGSYGAGSRIEFGYIHPLSDLIDLEMNVAYLSGKKIEHKTADTYYNGYDYSRGYTNSWQVSPMVRFKIATSGRAKPYLGFGPVFAFGTIFYEYEETDPTHSIVVGKKDSYSFDVGIKSIVGFNYSLGEKMSAFFELGLINLSVSPNESELTKFHVIYGGISYGSLDDFSPSQRITMYKENIGPVDTYSDFGNLKYLNNERPRYYSPLSSISLSFGIAYNLSEKKVQDKPQQ